MHVGLFGGTFNPIHHGHLIMAQEALLQADLDQVWLLPNARPPHKEAAAVGSAERLEMTRLAAAKHERLVVCPVELERQGPSYTYETVEILKARHPDYQFSFITGVDAVLKYEWKRFDHLLSLLNRFLVAARPGYDDSRLPAGLSVFNVPLIEISSTAIRNRVQSGQPITFWVPKPVEEYILKNRLYTQ